MKINDIKHNHSLTDLLKIGIFSILMCAPLIAIGSTCAYAIVNKNAYQSYSGNDQVKTEYINNKDNFIYENIYHFKSGNATSSTFDGGYTQYIQYEIVDVITNTSNIDIESFNAVGFYTTGTVVYYYFNNVGTTFTMDNNTNSNETIEFTFKYITNTLPKQNNILQITDSFYSIQRLTLDNVFYNATEKMTQSDLFNWTQNTAIFTGVQTMCTQLDIQTNVIPILIVYWFILTIIYVIIDIVLKCFTMLTHMLSKETH